MTFQRREEERSELAEDETCWIVVLGDRKMKFTIVEDDCHEWLEKRVKNSIHAVITDPPFGLIEYSARELQKMRERRGGIWRIPPAIGGSLRKPLPRFTVLSNTDLERLQKFFERWGKLILKVLTPGGHVFIASNPLLSLHVSLGLTRAGFECRGEIIRLVRTLRGGDRPKLAEKEFDSISVMPRSCFEPWGLFRKPIEAKRVSENLRKWGTGGLRRTPDNRPFPDVLKSEFPSDTEKEIAPHPSLKPQRFLRQIIWAALPLGKGTILDPFMGSGSTLAAAMAVGYESVGIEVDKEFSALARRAIPKLAALKVDWESFEGPNGNGSTAKMGAWNTRRLGRNERQTALF